MLASFSQVNAQQSTVTVYLDPDDGSWGTVTGDGTYNNGTTVTLTAHPASGYHLLAWEDDNGEYFYGDTYTFTINRDYEVMAHFERDVARYNLTATILPAGADTSCTVTGLGSKLEGTTPTVEAVVATGAPYAFDYWELGGVNVATTRTYQLAPMSSDVNMIAHFMYIPQERTISVASNDPTHGSVTLKNSASETGTSFNIYERDTLTLIATELDPTNYTFTGWFLGDVLLSTNLTYGFRLPEGSGNNTYTAHFENANIYLIHHE